MICLFNLAFLVSVFVLLGAGCFASRAKASLVPERRANPSKTAEGFMLVPAYNHIPGLGSFYGGAGLFSNVFNSETKLMAVGLTGDMNAIVLAASDIHLIKDTLIMCFGGFSTRMPQQIYERDPGFSDDLFFSQIKKEYGVAAEINLHLWERRLQLNTRVSPSRLQTVTVATKEGTGFPNRDDSEVDSLRSTIRLLLDLTDDNIDPRKGLKLQLIRDQEDIFDGYHSRFFVIRGAATAYVPVLRSSTWAFNFFRSGAVMLNQNNASVAELQSALSLNCGAIADAAERANCQSIENMRVRERIAENAGGTAGKLGGSANMRGYPLGRFHGSQSLFYATEFRWNISDEIQKFDLGFVKGSRSIVQVAPFFEMGTAFDSPYNAANAPLHKSYGIGGRIGFSGTLVRADLGFSEEGAQFTFFVGYPWDHVSL